jgi:hypothetical protein
MRSTVRKAARLAVYEEIMIRVKNHHIPATMRVETALLKYSIRRARWQTNKHPERIFKNILQRRETALLFVTVDCYSQYMVVV